MNSAGSESHTSYPSPASLVGPETLFDLRLVQHFVVLVEERSFSKAAERLFLSQSALTKQVQKLERTLPGNRRLVDRTQRPWRLTPTGHDFLALCNDLLTRVAQK